MANESLVYTNEKLKDFSLRITREVLEKCDSNDCSGTSIFAVLDKSSEQSSNGKTLVKPELKFETRSVPPLNPSDVQVKVFFGGLNFSDVYKYDGRFLQYTPLPLVLGMECSGKVEAVGSHVKEFEIGDFVVCYNADGGLFGTSVIIDRTLCYKIEKDHLFISCLLPTAYMTAKLALFDIARIDERMSVLFNGVSGSVGLAAADLVAIMGGLIYGTCSEQKIETVKGTGKVHKLFTYKQLETELKDTRFDIILDTHGGPAITHCINLLKPFGTLVILGAAGVVSSSAEDEAAWLQAGSSIQSVDLVTKNIKVAGAHLGNTLKHYPSHFNNSMDKIFSLLDANQIKPVLHGVYPFLEVESAIKVLLERKNVGKIVLRFI
ncbi:synaptic vesicle membrane protein VAT-1 homolog [Nilaparvata lugens]|uniref:synaptic vesicle membrane protein VAT-1 homolog n=1 Tax=Nilaparvata lugens TaxID=108931 RepID=UPI00193DFE25|nr:synaptic vesicle membrane protein VAT-1 homolog [Nilaparvata lugens]